MICKVCKVRQAEHKHHLFSKTKLNKKLYGKLIDDKRNIMFLCSVCHLNKPIQKLTEKQFCNILKIEVRSKTGH